MGNQKKWELMLALILIVAVSFMANNSQVLETSAIPEEAVVIGIDAGHGGVDTGKVGINNALEKDLNLEIANKVKEALEAQGITVIMSRENDDGLYTAGDSNKKQADLQRRCDIFKEAGCELVVSIHQNSYHEESVTGPQVFYYTTSVNGKLLAESIQEQLIAELKPEKERVAKGNDSYFLLRKVPCPIVIVECGFLSNDRRGLNGTHYGYYNGF